MQNQQQYIIARLNRQKKQLGITNGYLAQKTGLSIPTVQRILANKDHSVELAGLLSIADILGIDITASVSRSAQDMLKEKANNKAEKLLQLVRGNSALEGNEIDLGTYQDLLQRTVDDLLKGSKRALWVDI